MGKYDKIVIVRNNVKLQVLVILVVAFMLSANGQTNGRFIYRSARPNLGGEISVVPNPAPFLGDMTLLRQQEVKLRRI